MIEQNATNMNKATNGSASVLGIKLDSDSKRQDLPQGTSPFAQVLSGVQEDKGPLPTVDEQVPGDPTLISTQGDSTQKSDLLGGVLPDLSVSSEGTDHSSNLVFDQLSLNPMDTQNATSETAPALNGQKQPGLGDSNSQTDLGLIDGSADENIAQITIPSPEITAQSLQKGGATLNSMSSSISGNKTVLATNEHKISIPPAMASLDGEDSVSTVTVPGSTSAAQTAAATTMTAQQGTSLMGGQAGVLPKVNGSAVSDKGSKLETSVALNMTTTGQSTTSSDAVINVASQGQPGQSSMGQNGAQTPMQMMFAQLQQTQHLNEQRRAGQFAEALTKAKTTDSTSSDPDKVTSLLGDSGLSFDKRAQLPLGLQSINTPVRHPQWGQALSQRVVLMANQKIQEAKIMLNPEKLGPVQIKLHMDKDQMVHVSMHATHQVTRDAMENAIPKLKEMLGEAGIDFGGVDVGDQSLFEQNQTEEEFHQGQGTSSQIKLSESEEMPLKTTHLELKNDNIVDYYA